MFAFFARQTAGVVGVRWLRWRVVSAIVALAPPLAAAPIEWDAPDGCPGLDAVLADVRRALRSDALDLGAVSRVRGVVLAERAALPSRYRLTLEVVAGERRSSRSFEAESCDDLARAAALAISLAVHSGGAESGSASNTAALGAPSLNAPEASEPPLGSDGAPERETSASGEGGAPWWSAGANAVVDFGALPEAAVGIGLEARAGLGAWELGVHALLLQDQQLAVGGSDSVELGLMAAGLRACRRLLDRALVVGACLGAEVGRLTAVSVELERGREVHDPWLAVGPSVLARTLFDGPLQLELLAEPLLPLARKQYAVNGTDEVHTPSAVDVRVQLGLIIGGPKPRGP